MTYIAVEEEGVDERWQYAEQACCCVVAVWGGAGYMEGGGFHPGSGGLYLVVYITIVTEIHLHHYFILRSTRPLEEGEWESRIENAACLFCV